ncbi:uncharacterized protein [Antedon mediterranea]|uniref:uncharacterized protein n=1 Tax=Antedon mediterranea TaxID=105859 RepID=UPI003AF98195
MEENKKRNASLAGIDRPPATNVIVSPPSKKLKQCRLPFQLLTPSPTPNQKPATQIDQETNKRKRAVSGESLESPVSRTKSSENKPKLAPVKKFKSISNSTSDAEVSSSSEAASSHVLVLEADSSSQSSKPVVLDQFFNKTQQPEVSTSDGEDVIERCGLKSKNPDEEDTNKIIDECIKEVLDKKKSKTPKVDIIQASPDTSVQKSPTATEKGSSVMDECKMNPDRSKKSEYTVDDDCIIITDSPLKADDDCFILTDAATKSKDTTGSIITGTPKMSIHASKDDDCIILINTPKTSKDYDCVFLKDTPKTSKVSIISPKHASEKEENSKTVSPKDGEMDVVTTPVHVRTGAKPVRKLSASVVAGKTPEVKERTPVTKGKTPNKTPKSAKALEKEAERKRKQEEKERLIKEKKQKLEEEKAEKQRIRDEAKAAKEKERLEAKRMKDLEKEKKEKERLEKKQKEEESRQEILKKKEEEKKKKQETLEARLQEKKKKEDEKRKQEEEESKLKEEKRLKQQKQEKKFFNFFTKAPEPAAPSEKTTPNLSCGPFAAFELKDGMTLAPRVRRVIDDDAKQELTRYISNQIEAASYLEDIKCAGFKPGKDLKTPRPIEPDVVVISEGKQLVKCKFLKFHENYRPAFYGTMRKKSAKVRARNPFALDEIFDYEVDSDEEWEEPGESLSNSEGEDEPASDDDEDDDGFFVPHGYLSEDEGGNECEDGIKKMKEKQAAKAQAWEAGLKKKLEVLTPELIGPIWVGEDNDHQSKQWKILQQYAAIVLVNTPISTSFSRSPAKEKTESAGEADGKNILGRKGVPKEAIPDLMQLVHGNTAGIKTLSRTFREYWNKKEQNAGTKNIVKGEFSPGKNATCADIREPSPVNDHLESSSRPATPSADAEFSISARQMKLKINKIAVRERRNGYDRDCWYVHEELLKKHNLLDLPVPNAAVVVKEKKPKNADNCVQASTPKVNQIAQFAKKLSPEAYQKQTQQSLAVLKEKQDQERIRKERERALQLKLQQQQIERYRQEQEKAAQLALANARKAAQYATSNHLMQQSSLLQSIHVMPSSRVIFQRLPSVFTSTQDGQNSKPCPPQKTTQNVVEILAKKQNLLLNASSGGKKSLPQKPFNLSTSDESLPQKMEVDCGYSADSEGQGL